MNDMTTRKVIMKLPRTRGTKSFRRSCIYEVESDLAESFVKSGAAVYIEDIKEKEADHERTEDLPAISGDGPED